MRNWIRVALVVLLSLQVWHAVRLTRYDARMREGRRADRAWNAERALELFRQARRLAARDSDAWRRTGDVALYMHDFPDQIATQPDPAQLLDMAWEAYAGAVLRSPVDPWSWTGLSEVALGRARLEEQRHGLDLSMLTSRSRGIVDGNRAAALTAALVAVSLKPSGFYALDALAEVYESAGNLDEANALYLKSARMMPVAGNHAWSFGRRLPRRVYSVVIEGMREGVTQAPDFERSTLHLEIGRFAMAQGDLDTAVEEMQRAEEVALRRYERYNAAWELARAMEHLGEFEAALEALQRAAAGSPRPETLQRRIGLLQLRIGRYADACASLRQAMTRDGDTVAALRTQTVRACESAGEIGLAEQILSAGFVLPSDNLTLARELIDFHRRNGNDYRANYLLRTWARDFPDEPDIQAWVREAELHALTVQ